MSTEERIAKITRADIGWEDHGIFTVTADLDYGNSSCQGVPGYVLDKPGPDGRQGTAFGLTWIMRFMEACGVRDWSKVAGRTVIAVIEDGMVCGIKPLPTEPGRAFLFDTLTSEADR